MRHLIAAIVLAAPCAAPCAASAEDARTNQVHLAFSAYAAGLNVINLQSGIEMTPIGYRVSVDFKTAGMFGALIRGQTESIAAGAWHGTGVVPSRFYSYGTLRGIPRRTQIDFEAGQPVVKILEPPVDQEREPVPPQMALNTIDTLSAMAELVHNVVLSGGCDGQVTIFDGHRVSEIAVHRVGQQVLPKEERSIFSGPALRCDFEGRQTAGFVRDVDRTELTKPQKGSAWLAPVMPGGPPLPVRMTFHTRFFGDATMYLTKADLGPLPEH